MSTIFGRGTLVFQEHADLRPIVAELRRHAMEVVFGRRVGELCQKLLDEFFEQLLAHFSAEENEGYFGTVVEDHPELSVRVERLMAQHEEMVDAVERLRSLGGPTSSDRDLGLGLLMLLDCFELHEKEENVLMQTFLSMAPAAVKAQAPVSSARRKQWP